MKKLLAPRFYAPALWFGAGFFLPFLAVLRMDFPWWMLWFCLVASAILGWDGTLAKAAGDGLREDPKCPPTTDQVLESRPGEIITDTEARAWGKFEYILHNDVIYRVPWWDCSGAAERRATQWRIEDLPKGTLIPRSWSRGERSGA